MPAEARPIRPDAGDGDQPHRFGAGPAPPRLTPLRELQLIDAYRAGGPEAHRAMTELLSAYQRRIYSVCLRMVRRPEDAADLTQDVLLKLVENLSSYDGRSKLSTWIIRVAMNASLSHLRRRKVRDERSLEAMGPPALGAALSGLESRGPVAFSGREPSPAESVEQGERRAAVLQALDSLDPETQAILVLRDMHDLDYQQLADVLDVPLGTVKSRLFRARAALRTALESNQEEPQRRRDTGTA